MTAKCANRKEKNKGKALNVAWDDDFAAESSGPESHDNWFENCVASIALSTTSSMHGSSNRESKSNEDLDSNDFSNNEKN